MSEGESPKSYDNAPEDKRPEAFEPDLSSVVEERHEPSPAGERQIVEEFAEFLTPEEMKEYEGEGREEIVSYIFDQAIGHTAVDTIPNDVWDRICAKGKSAEAIWKVIGEMKRKGMGAAIDADERLRERVIAIFLKGEKEPERERPEGMPEGLPSTEEAVEQSRKKSLLRRMAMRVAGGAEAIKWAAGSPVAATKHLAYKFLTHSSESQEKWNEKFRNMSPEERRKYERKAIRNANLAVLAGGAIYLAYRSHGFDWFTHDSNGNNGVEPGSGSNSHPDMPEDIPSGSHDFVYDPKLDPARDPAKHHNDWGTMPPPSPEDAGKPSGYADFFNNRLKHSPEELSATLSEFGLNGKDAHAITELANQMEQDPKLYEQKYNQLIALLNNPNVKISTITDSRDYGSYYAVANPDGTVTLSYDTYVDASHNLQTYGQQGNEFVVIELPDGSKHYAHKGCGWQWSHFINPAPAPKQVVYTPAPSHSSTVPAPTKYQPPHNNYVPPTQIYTPPEVVSPPPVYTPEPPPAPPPAPTPEPTPPPPPVLQGKGVEAGPPAIRPLPVDDFEPAPAPVKRTSTATSPNGVTRTESITSPVNAPNANRVEGTTASQLHTSGPSEAPRSSSLHGAAKKPK